MSTKTTASISIEVDDDYYTLEKIVSARVLAAAGRQLFRTATGSTLFDTYLAGIPEDRRQHYNCHCCRKFIQDYGGLVTIEGGSTSSVLWSEYAAPNVFAHPLREMKQIVEKAQVIGVFLTSESTWGTPKTKDWTHLSGIFPGVFSGVKTADQVVAEKSEDRKMLLHGIADYSLEVISQAVQILRVDGVDRSEKALAIGEWFFKVAREYQDSKGSKRNNLLWAAVADAPPGFCHVRSTMISTLLDDLKSGIPYGTIVERWAKKMHPLQYQRPTAPPKEGQIEAAEKLVEKLGVAPSLLRRAATLADVLKKEWEPTILLQEAPREGKVFDHLREQKHRMPGVEVPAVNITWEKFARTVLPTASEIEVLVPIQGPFYGLLTATVPESPPILQWDGLEGHPRNPCSWYFYHGGSVAKRWDLTPGWVALKAIFLSPFMWQEPQRFSNHEPNAFFAIEGCVDRREPSICLFPESLRSDLHGIRSVVEAHSRSAKATGVESGTANGLALSKGSNTPITVRTRVSGVTSTYKIDRWD